MSLTMPLETPLTEPLKSSKTPHTPQQYSETDFCKELNLMKDCIKTLETENELIKIFIKEQLYVIKKINQYEETVNENVKLIQQLQKVNEKLEQENDSKITLIKILAKKKNGNIATTQNNTEQFKQLKEKQIQQKK